MLPMTVLRDLNLTDMTQTQMLSWLTLLQNQNLKILVCHIE